MLIPLHKLDPDNKAKCQVNGWVALDPKSGATLRKSKEALEPGKEAQYFLYIPDVMLRVIWAKSDREAIATANNGAK